MTPGELTPLANHVWQSTVFVAVAWGLTLALRGNRAAVRYGVWMAASVKFLVPFAWLAEVGARVHWRAAAPVAGTVRIPVLAAQMGEPFRSFEPAAAMAAAPVTHWWPAALAGVWVCGVVAGLAYWMRAHGRMRGALRGAKALDLGLPIPVMAAPGGMEPGVFGIWRPVLLLPEGIAERLTAEQLEAVLAHELRHVRRRDNLTAAIHMVVETVFWFHPAVWWIRARLIEERERACDEGVLRLGSEPRVYAESILKVCEFYLAAPVCAAGVTGGELKKRIEGIMENRFGVRMGFGKRALLAAAGVVAVLSPIAIGLMAPRHGGAQQTASVAVGAAPAPTQEPVRSAPAQADRPSGATASPQAPPAKLEFEVVSVKPSPKLNGPSEAMAYRREGGGSRTDDSQAVMLYVSLSNLAQMAFRLPEDQITGPAWMADAHFDIAGKLPAGASKSNVPEMLQAMLADRFKMTVHHEERVRPVYLLVRGKGPLAMKESTDAPGHPPYLDGGPGRGYDFQGATTEDLASFLSQFHRMGVRGMSAGYLSDIWPDRPVVDKTGLTGKYDFKFGAGYPGTDMRDGDVIPDPSAMVTASAALKALGLALEPSRQGFDYVIIDHIERVPTEN